MSNARLNLTRQQVLALLDGASISIGTPQGRAFDIVCVADRAWKPLEKIAVPDHIVKAQEPTGEVPAEMWRNDDYEVMVYLLDEAGAKHLSIKRYDRAPIRNWRHMQQIKNEVCGQFAEGVELYPSEARVADNANQYHLWVLSEGMEIPLGWPSGFVVRRDDEVEAYNKMPHGGRQEPMQEGLTVGEALDAARSPEQDIEIRKILGQE